MSRIVPISEVLKMEPGEIPPVVRGKCVNVWKYRSGEGKDGPYSFQDIVLEDGGEKLTVTVKNRDEYPWKEIKEKEVTIIAGRHSNNGKLIGVEVYENDYNGKKELRLRVTPSAEIIIGKFDRSKTGGDIPAEQPPKMRKTERLDTPPRQQERNEDPTDDSPRGHDYSGDPVDHPTERTPEPPNHPPVRSGVVDVYSGAPADWSEFDARLEKLTRAYVRCAAAAAKVGQMVTDKGIETLLEPQAVITTLFLSAKGKDQGFLDLVPRPTKK